MNKTVYDNQRKTHMKGYSDKYSLQKLEDSYVKTLESLVVNLCDVITEAANSITLTENLQRTIQELKFHEKMKVEQNNNISNIINCLNDVSNLLRNNHNSDQNKINYLPLVKNNYYGNFGSLATIAQKDSEQNLLSNYIRKSHYVRKLNHLTLKDNQSEALNKVNYEYNREQTRRSLDIPSLNQHKKPLYSQLQRINGKDTLLMNHKNPLFPLEEKRPRKSKLTEYKISKFI